MLSADGKPDVPAVATRGYWIDPEKGVRDFYLRIEPADFARMATGVDYALSWVDEEESLGWRVAPDVVIRRRQ